MPERSIGSLTILDRIVAETLRPDKPLSVDTASQIAVAHNAPNDFQGHFIMHRLEDAGLAKAGNGGYVRGDKWLHAAARYGWAVDKPLLEVLPDERGAIEQ